MLLLFVQFATPIKILELFLIGCLFSVSIRFIFQFYSRTCFWVLIAFGIKVCFTNGFHVINSLSLHFSNAPFVRRIIQYPLIYFPVIFVHHGICTCSLLKGCYWRHKYTYKAGQCVRAPINAPKPSYYDPYLTQLISVKKHDNAQKGLLITSAISKIFHYIQFECLPKFFVSAITDRLLTPSYRTCFAIIDKNSRLWRADIDKYDYCLWNFLG